MSAWVKEGQEDQGQVIANVDKVFEDNFVTSDPEIRQEKTFEKLNDSDDYLKLLGKRVVLSQNYFNLFYRSQNLV